MKRPIDGKSAVAAGAIAFAIAMVLISLSIAPQNLAAATETPQAQSEATATATPTPRPTRTPLPTPAPPVVLTPLPSLDDLRFYTPVAEVPTEPPAEPATATPAPATPAPATPAPSTIQPPRAPVRATTRSEPTPVPMPVVENATLAPAQELAPEATSRAAAPLPTAASRSTRLSPPVSNAQPPIDLTPAGMAGGGPASTRAPLTSSTLVVVGIGLLAAGGSWGFYYLLRESD